MTKKQGIRTILFLIVLCGVLSGVNSVLGMPKNDNVVLMARRFQELYEDPEDTWDGIVLGTSIADRGWAAPLAWEKYGMTVYPMATDKQPFVLSTNVLEEVRKYQDISFAVVELSGIRKETLKISETRIRWLTDQMKCSPNRFRTITKALNYMDYWYPGEFSDDAVYRLAYYFPLLKYHTRLTKGEFYEGDFGIGETTMKGTYEGRKHTGVSVLEPQKCSTEKELNEQQIVLLEELLTYAEETDLKLFFYFAPNEFSEKMVAQFYGAERYLEERGYDVLNFHREEVLEASGIDWEEDFIDTRHLNTKGARKLTEYVADYIHENLELTDHRGEKGYESWDEAAENYDVFYQEALTEIEKNAQKARVAAME